MRTYILVAISLEGKLELVESFSLFSVLNIHQLEGLSLGGHLAGSKLTQLSQVWLLGIDFPEGVLGTGQGDERKQCETDVELHDC